MLYFCVLYKTHIPYTFTLTYLTTYICTCKNINKLVLNTKYICISLSLFLLLIYMFCFVLLNNIISTFLYTKYMYIIVYQSCWYNYCFHSFNGKIVMLNIY